MTSLDLRNNRITNITPLQGLTNLTFLDLAGNGDLVGNTFIGLSDITPLQGLTNLTELVLDNNDISDISALVRNSGLGSGDTVDLRLNPLSRQALVDVQTLIARGVTVKFSAP